MAANTTSGKTIRVVNPAAEMASKGLTLAPRLRALQGLRIGIIDNKKHMAGPFLDATKRLLEERYGVASFEHFHKYSASIRTPPDVIEQISRTCDAVITGVAD